MSEVKNVFGMENRGRTYYKFHNFEHSLSKENTRDFKKFYFFVNQTARFL